MALLVCLLAHAATPCLRRYTGKHISCHPNRYLYMLRKTITYTFKPSGAAQLMLWSAGLRGAVAFGLVLQLRPTPGPDQAPQEGLPAIEAATLVIVVTSTLLFGTATGPLLRHLNLEASARSSYLHFCCVP